MQIYIPLQCLQEEGFYSKANNMHTYSVAVWYRDKARDEDETCSRAIRKNCRQEFLMASNTHVPPAHSRVLLAVWREERGW